MNDFDPTPEPDEKLIETRWASLRQFLQAHPGESWWMLGGTFAGQQRTAEGLLTEVNTVTVFTTDGRHHTLDTMDFPVVDRNGVIVFPKGIQVFGMTIPMDMPFMSKEWTR